MIVTKIDRNLFKISIHEKGKISVNRLFLDTNQKLCSIQDLLPDSFIKKNGGIENVLNQSYEISEQELRDELMSQSEKKQRVSLARAVNRIIKRQEKQKKQKKKQ